MDIKRNLGELRVGESARIISVDTADGIRRRLLDVGFVVGTSVECIGRSPLGDPKAYRIRGKVIAIRDRDAKGVLIG
jgi:ferrous iron transport protein A